MEGSPLGEDARCARLFWTWLVARTAVWFGAIAITQPNPLQDLLESLAWGRHFAWGYPKQPPLTSWLAGAFGHVSPGDVWGLYLAGFLMAAVCLWAVWRVGLEFLPPRAALVAVLGLDGLVYLAGDAADFNNNIALIALWVLVVLAFVRATRTGAVRWWLALGLAAGLGLLCKYPILFLLAALAGYLVLDPRGRRHLSRPGPYLSALVAAALFAPHVAWLVGHDYLPLEYAAARSAGAGGLGRVRVPLVFLLGQLVKLLPVLAIVAPLLERPAAGRTSAPERAVLHWSVLGPLALLLLYALVTGAQLRERWGGPFVVLAGVWLLSVAGSQVPVRLRWSAAAWGLVSVGLVVFWVGRIVASPYVTSAPPRGSYPGRRLAEEVERRWHARRAGPVPIVAGEAWRASNVCGFSGHRPVLYSSGDMGLLTFDPRHAFWTDDSDLDRRGGVILWGAYQLGDAIPAPIRARFPDAESLPPIVLPYETGARVRPDRVGIAIVAPAGDRTVR
jgi:4-amino-4-deoxy-L-arabinose transferase-like glycosyltransferase